MSRLNYATFEDLLRIKYYRPEKNGVQMFEILALAAFDEAERENADLNYPSADEISTFRRGKRHFPKKLREPWKKPNVRDIVAIYFEEEVLPHVPKGRHDDLFRDIKDIIEVDTHIPDKQKDIFISLARPETFAYFLAEVLVYVVMMRPIKKKAQSTFPANNLPFGKNRYFEGRNNELEQINDALCKNTIPCVISGIGRHW